MGQLTLVRQLGLSLVELMIAITLGLVLMAGVVQMFVSSKTVYTTQQNLTRIQETGRLAIEFLSRDLRMAGNMGCFREDTVNKTKTLDNSSLAINGLYGNFKEFVRGYSSESILSAAQKTYIGKTTKTNTNLLTVRYANPVPRIINATNTNTTLQTYTSDQVDATNCVDGLCVGEAAVVSTCFKARLFKVSALSSSGSNLTVSHADDWAIASSPGNSYSSGELLRMNAATYFIADGVSGAPALWLKLNEKPAVEILEGVESVVYKFSTYDNRTYRTADLVDVNDWVKVVSARIFVVARSIDSSVPEPQPYVVDGVSTTPTDKYMRQVFTATVALRGAAGG
jgi:type IV pilus assembly protein PilW